MLEPELIYLVGEMRSGSVAARNRLIVEHAGVAVAAACKQFKDKSEFKSACYLRLVEATDDFARSSIPAQDYSGYVKTAIQNAAVDVARDDMRHSARIRRKFEHGSQSQVVTFLTKTTFGQYVKVTAKVKSAPRTTTLSEHDAMDSVLAVVETQVEERVVKLKAEGRTNKEVALTVGMTEQKVGRMLYDLEKRYVEMNP